MMTRGLMRIGLAADHGGVALKREMAEALRTAGHSVFLMNLICVNLAGVTTFLVQGIHPASWWEKDRAVKATRVAIGL